MAKVKFSALISEMRNKLNGSVFSRNRGGSYLRNKVTPVNPQSIAQVAARNRLTTFSQGWRGLTQAQRDAWNAIAPQYARPDIFGDLKNPSGQQLYVKLNVNLDNVGGAAITDPPTPTATAALTSVTLTAAETGPQYDVAFAPTPIPANTAMLIESTPGLSPGISNFNSQFRVIGTATATDTSPADLSAEQVAKFGAISAGLKYAIRVRQINTNTGIPSQALVSTGVAGA